MKICKPNYKFAEEKALEFIKTLDSKQLPIKLMGFKNIYKDLEIKTYSWYSRTMGLPIEKVCEDLGSEDGCCVYNNVNGKYRIYYNDTIKNEGRKRWTLAHELGHYALKHHESSGRSILQRSGMSLEEYGALEKEANCFARELLAPPPVLRKINIANKHFISELCNISWEAADNVHNFITTGAQMGFRYTSDNPIVKHFSEFIFDIKHASFCNNCNHKFSSENAKFCPVCGRDGLIKSTLSLFRRNNAMIFPSIELDDEMRVKQCPKCDNEEVSGNYCMICGSYLFNVCTGMDPNEYPNFDYEGTRWDKSNGGCENVLEGNARYCSSCGSTSSFYEERVLENWNKEPIEEKQPVPTSSNPFDSTDDSVPDITDADLPF